MSASDDFPRGWDLRAVFAAGATPLLTIPASPGIAHVLTAIDLQLSAGAAPASSIEDTVQDSTGSVYGIVTADTTAFSSALFTWTGKTPYSLGLLLTIELGGVLPVGWAAVMEIQGYDV